MRYALICTATVLVACATQPCEYDPHATPYCVMDALPPAADLQDAGHMCLPTDGPCGHRDGPCCPGDTIQQQCPIAIAACVNNCCVTCGFLGFACCPPGVWPPESDESGGCAGPHHCGPDGLCV